MIGLSQRLESEQIPFERNCPLAPRSSFRIGGTVELAVFPHSRETLLTALRLVTESGMPYCVIGNGSNVLFPDGAYHGVFIFTGNVRELSVCANRIAASAGVLLGSVAKLAKEHSLSGAEFAAGIPGTVGGAVFMNAGAFGGCMEQITVSSDYWDAASGNCGHFAGAEQEFSTRSSVYSEHPEYIILGAVLELREGNRQEIESLMKQFAARRRETQPLELPNAGSIFKHPAGHFAGKLIDDCGLKGLTVGGASVSKKHAGFIVNTGGATCEDVRRLIELIRERVFRETGIRLACELRLVGGGEL